MNRTKFLNIVLIGINIREVDRFPFRESYVPLPVTPLPYTPTVRSLHNVLPIHQLRKQTTRSRMTNITSPSCKPYASSITNVWHSTQFCKQLTAEKCLASYRKQQNIDNASLIIHLAQKSSVDGLKVRTTIITTCFLGSVIKALRPLHCTH